MGFSISSGVVSPSGGLTTSVNSTREDAVGGENLLSIGGLSLLEAGAYTAVICCSNNTDSSASFNITINDQAETLFSFSVGGGATQSVSFHLNFSINYTRNGDMYIAVDYAKVGTSLETVYSGIVSDLTSIDLEAVTTNAIGDNSYIQVWGGSGFAGAASQIGLDYFIENGGLRIGGTNGPFHKLHISDGNIFVEGGGETGLLFKRLDTNSGSEGPDGVQTNPIFYFGRVSQAGDGSWETKMMFSSDQTAERVVSKWDSKGILAMIQPDIRGRVFESYLVDGHVNPWLALSSEGVNHRLEFGPGDDADMDTAVTRTGTQSLSLQVGPTSQTLQSKITIYGDAAVIHSGVSVIMPEFAIAPGSPGLGSYKVYFKDDGQLYKKNSNGKETLAGSNLFKEDSVPTGETQKTLQFTGLDLKAHKAYRFAGAIISANGAFTLEMKVNGTATVIADLVTTSTTGSVRNFSGEILFYPSKTGTDNYAAVFFRSNTTAAAPVEFSALLDNVTSIEIESTAVDGLDENSYANLYHF